MPALTAFTLMSWTTGREVPGSIRLAHAPGAGEAIDLESTIAQRARELRHAGATLGTPTSR